MLLILLHPSDTRFFSKRSKRHCSDLVTNIRGLQRTNERSGALTKGIEFLTKKKDRSRAPETYLLDDSQDGVSTTISAGDSICTAKAKLHCAKGAGPSACEPGQDQVARQGAFVERKRASTTSSSASLDIGDEEFEGVKLARYSNCLLARSKV